MAAASPDGIPAASHPATRWLSRAAEHLARLGDPPAFPALAGGPLFDSRGAIEAPPGLVGVLGRCAVGAPRWWTVEIAGNRWSVHRAMDAPPVLLCLAGAGAARRGDLLAHARLAISSSRKQADAFLDLCAATPALAGRLGALPRLALSPLPALLRGETGTGKEVVARALHAMSARRGPFLAENCAALPETLLESELFGARRGAFTGADRDRRGLLLAAAGGSVLLDEVGDLPPALQAKLLRVLQEREVRPLGSSRALAVDLRFLAATHRDLREMCRRGEFRLDLYYRLAGMEICLPPLRERPADIPPLAATLLARGAKEGLGPGRWLAPDALDLAAGLPLPGNARELDHLLRRAMVLSGGPLIEPSVLGQLASGEAETVANLEEQAIRRALDISSGVKAAAARRLGWSRQKLYRRLRALDLYR